MAKRKPAVVKNLGGACNRVVVRKVLFTTYRSSCIAHVTLAETEFCILDLDPNIRGELDLPRGTFLLFPNQSVRQ